MMLLPVAPPQLGASDVLLGTMLGSWSTLLQPAVMVVVWPTTIFDGDASIQPVGCGCGGGGLPPPGGGSPPQFVTQLTVMVTTPSTWPVFLTFNCTTDEPA